MNKTFHVAKTGCDFAAGTKDAPFLTINKAAQVAETGDTVVVHEGEYREWVKPAHSGYSEISRIVYEAAQGEKVIIKGSERITNWENVEGTVWKATLPNEMFGDYNPYKETLDGDWYAWPEDKFVHPGEVYLNGTAFFEARTLGEVKNPPEAVDFILPWLTKVEKLPRSKYQWYCESDDETTTIYANFQGADPNKELVEVNVRKCCFYPEKPGMNYITVRGFEMAQAATPWTPPTADQPGLLGVHWSKGWVIEDNIIHDAKCSGLSLGKEASTGHNLSVRRRQKPGYQYQMEAVYRAVQLGWSKETIGSHIVRNNVIYNCGQNGIVGHMGCVFSEIYDNHIYNIAVRREFYGHELGGIKLHAAIDVSIRHNRIHHCEKAIWLDWQAQGTRVTQNLFYENFLDLMIEVTHGPCLVDNNIFASEHVLNDYAQGTAYVGNLFCGKTHAEKVLDRSTPYHFPHSTQVAGSVVVYGQDHRYCNNIFVGLGDSLKTGPAGKGIDGCGTGVYNGSTASYEEYNSIIFSYGIGDLELFQKTEQPICTSGNVYFKGAEAFDREKNNLVQAAFDPKVTVIEDGETVYLELVVPAELADVSTKIESTATLGTVRIADATFDAPDGTSIVLNTDYLGQTRAEKPSPGPLEGLKTGSNRMKVWG